MHFKSYFTTQFDANRFIKLHNQITLQENLKGMT